MGDDPAPVVDGYLSDLQVATQLTEWLRALTDGTPWAEDMTCIGCGKRQYRVERDGGAHRPDCAWVAARAHLATLGTSARTSAERVAVTVAVNHPAEAPE